jgi:hypothetical protein
MSVKIIITSYTILYSSNKFARRIGLKKDNDFIGQLIFHDNNLTNLPIDSEVKFNGKIQYNLNYRLDDFANCIAILKERKIKLLYYNGATAENGISID